MAEGVKEEGETKNLQENRSNGTSGESFGVFVICSTELDSVGVLWKQTQTVKNREIAEQSTENELSRGVR